MLSPGISIFAVFLYGLMTYTFKSAIFRRLDLESPARRPWTTGNELFLIISPDLWWAFRFKNRISSANRDSNIIPEEIRNPEQHFQLVV